MTQTPPPPRSAESPAQVSLPNSPRAGTVLNFHARLPRLDVERGDEPRRAVLAAGHADHHFVLHDERRDRRRIPLFIVLERDVPDDLAGSGVERDQVGVERRHEQPAAQHREAAVHRAAAGAQIGRERPAIAPERLAGFRIERPGDVVRAGGIEHAVVDEGGRLQRAEGSGLERPLMGKPLHVLRRDLGERTVSLRGVVAAEHQPLRLILVAGHQPFRRHRLGLLLCAGLRRERQHHTARRKPSPHRCSSHFSNRGASPLGLPDTLSRALARRAGHTRSGYFAPRNVQR